MCLYLSVRLPPTRTSDVPGREFENSLARRSGSFVPPLRLRRLSESGRPFSRSGDQEQ